METALFFETLEQIYQRVFQTLKPHTPVPIVAIQFRPYANVTSRIRLADGRLTVDISDLLEHAPAPIQEALAYILLAKLFRKKPDPSILARYQRYLNRSDIRQVLHHAKRKRGRKLIRGPQGAVYDLGVIFEELNVQYFQGTLAKPRLGWSLKPSRTTLGHYDPPHHTIVLNCMLDSTSCPELLTRFVLFHEMLHLQYPTAHNGTRRCVHSKEFKAAEKEFQQYAEAKKVMRAFMDEAWSFSKSARGSQAG